jgi:hypothetical protein
MKKIMIVLLAAVTGMAACKKEMVSPFKGATENIYFNLAPYGYKDSILYTFANHPEKPSDTVWIPVRLSGSRVDSNLVYAAKIIDSGTTAQVNKHYQPLKSGYVLPAGSGTSFMPVVLYNTDTMLFQRSFALTIQLVSTDQLHTELTQMLTARIVFSTKLERPVWWTNCPGGSYSIVKHLLFRLSATTEDVSNDGAAIPLWLYYKDKLNALLTSPKTWIANNPGKGYVLDPRPDGNFDFYDPAKPDKKFLYRKKTGTNSFYFVDENGNDVI